MSIGLFLGWILTGLLTLVFDTWSQGELRQAKVYVPAYETYGMVDPRWYSYDVTVGARSWKH